MSQIIAALDRLGQKLTPDVVRFYSQMKSNPIIEIENTFSESVAQSEGATQMMLIRQFEAKLDRFIKVYKDYVDACDVKIDRTKDASEFYQEEMNQYAYSSVLCESCKGGAEERKYILVRSVIRKDEMQEPRRMIESVCDRCRQSAAGYEGPKS